jgi:hypothetical protein
MPRELAGRPESETAGEIVSLEKHRSGEAGAENSLIRKRELENLRARWTSIQAGFVDQPRKSVQDADALVSLAIQHISESFRNQREQLEKQWSTGDDASTEDLRRSFQKYRTFFNDLLSV